MKSQAMDFLRRFAIRNTSDVVGALSKHGIPYSRSKEDGREEWLFEDGSKISVSGGVTLIDERGLKVSLRKFLIDYVSARTNTFGGGRVDKSNPISMARGGGGGPPRFSLGQDVGEVVDLVLEGIKKAETSTLQIIDGEE